MYDRSTTVRNLLVQSGIQEHMDKKGITEVVINEPLQVLTESSQGWDVYPDSRCTLQHLEQLVNALAIYNNTHISANDPIKSVTFPDGQRGQIVMPPATTDGTVSLTIRIPSTGRFSLEDYLKSGRLDKFSDVSDFPNPEEHSLYSMLLPWEKNMLKFKKTGDMASFWQSAIEHKTNIVLVGGTGSGKTTFTKAIADLVSLDTRIITLEDTHELDLPLHKNKKHLFYGKGSVTPKALISSCMRMKPDRVFLTELRGDEAWDYLSLLNTGHPGSITTVHANDCRSAFHRIATLIQQSEVGQQMTPDFIIRQVMTTLHVVAYFSRTRMIQLYYDPIAKLKLERAA